MSKIVFFEIEIGEREQLQKLLPEGNVVYTPEKLDPITSAEFKDAEIISTFISSDLSEKTLKGLTNLKMIATRSTGFDHIDLAECRRRGIVVANVPSYGEYTVAEHTFALILSLSRNIHKAYMRMRSSAEQFTFEGLMGFDLKGKTLGVIGAGHIGMHVIKIARGFSMRVLAYDVQKSPLLADVLGYEYGTLDHLLENSDIISIHAPYNKHTHHLINQSNIDRIKKGALLINTARGGVVETEALLHALDRGILGGAGLDVLEGERLVREEREILSKSYSAEEMRVLLANHLLMNRENVVITPHLAFYSKEAVMRILETTVENILAFQRSEQLNVVS
ncbi:MAG TPA: hydroxyacid dehydrogenase [Acidobacteriota bacterium]|nr:hydroxyacid dehydrogenase [Acidobacteriota bacterium]